MPRVSLPIVGPTYTNRSLPVNSQITRNFYIEVNQEGGEPVALMPFPGLKSFATIGTSSETDRGIGEYNGGLYKVSGNTLYSVNSFGIETSLGTIPGTEQCDLVSDGVSLVITYGTGKPITWNGSVLTTGTDVDLPNASTSAYINRRIVYDGTGASIAFADLDAALDVNSFNVTTVSSSPDAVLAVIEHDLQILVFTAKTITPYYNSGAGNPPFDVIQNAVRNVGLKAIHSLASNKDFVYFLGADLMVYRYAGLQAQAIGNPAIGQAIEGYTAPESAVGFTFTFHSQNFYYLSFPGEESWLFNESSGWTNLANGVLGDSHLMNSYVNIYGKHLVGDRTSGNIYELDEDTYTDKSLVIQRQRDTVQLSGKTFGQPGAEVFMESLELILETGTSLITGQGSDAEIMMQYSDDGGRSFSAERRMNVGRLGEYQTKLEWFELGSFYNRMFRFKMSDPIKWTLISLHAEVSLGV